MTFSTRVSAVIIALMATFAGTNPGSAAPITSTGVGLVGSAETRWTATNDAAPDTPLALTIVQDECCFGGAWHDSAGPAHWITPYATGVLAANDPSANESDAQYTYSLVFDNPNANVTVSWASDNDAEFFLNGISLSTIGNSGYASLVSFSIAQAVFSASNIFTVSLLNTAFSPNPTGLFVDVQASAVPLPAALPLLAGGLGGMGALSWWRKRKDRRQAVTA